MSQENNTKKNEVENNVSNAPFPKRTTAFISQKCTARISRRVHGGKTKGRPRLDPNPFGQWSEGRPFTETTSKNRKSLPTVRKTNLGPHLMYQIFSLVSSQNYLAKYYIITEKWCVGVPPLYLPRAKGTGS